MPVRGVIAESDAPRAPTIAAEKIGGDPAFIDKHVLPRVVERERFVPAAALSGDVGAALFVGVNRFF
jgi:hypothetical protein